MSHVHEADDWYLLGNPGVVNLPDDPFRTPSQSGTDKVSFAGNPQLKENVWM